MKRPAAVLFDLDGTLIESRNYWFHVVTEASAHFGGIPVLRPQFDASFGQSAAADVAEFFPAAKVADVDHFYNHALPRHSQHLERAPGAEELLKRLSHEQLPAACVTNSPSTFMRNALEAVGLLSA